MRFQEKSLQDASFLHDQERRKTPTYPPLSEQGFDKVKSLWKEKGGGSGEGRGNLSLERFPLPSPDSSSLPNLQQHIVNQPRLAKTNGKRAQSHVLNAINLGQGGGIDDGDVILLPCGEMRGQIATDGLNDSGGVAFPPGGETGGSSSGAASSSSRALWSSCSSTA